MLKCLFVVFSCLWGAHAHANNTEDLQSYLHELLEKKLLDNTDLTFFLTQLKLGHLINPMTCEPCTSIQLIHKANLDLFLEVGDYELPALANWVSRLIEDHEQDSRDRSQVQEETKRLLKVQNTTVSIGQNHACAIDYDKKVQCWGDGSLLQVVPDDLGPVSSLAACYYGTCAVMESGDVRCWGLDSIKSAVPKDLPRPAQISCGYYDACIIDELGKVRCWGPNQSLLENFPDDEPISYIHVSAYRVYAVSESGNLYCRGNNPCDEGIPKDLKPVKRISSGSLHTCAVQQDGEVRCWNTRPSRYKGHPTNNLRNVQDITIGQSDTCILESDGKVRCWRTQDLWLVSSPIAIDEVVRIFGGGELTCALDRKGKLSCWGHLANSRLNAVPPNLKVKIEL